MLELLTTEEFCNYFKISRKTIYNWRKNGLPYMKQQGTIRYDKNKSEEWLTRGRWKQEKRRELLDAVNARTAEAEKIICKYDSMKRFLTCNHDDYFNKDNIGRDQEDCILNEMDEMATYCDIENLKFYYDISIYHRMMVNNNKQKIDYDLLFKVSNNLYDILKIARTRRTKDGEINANDEK